ncbi:hypothetical protein B0H14DRAFT_3477592 [Mycena olivaceomarginata]|nr:hypothetical protein B0H14DRAFT_3477592 [Mycena olivaceomarginata]
MWTDEIFIDALTDALLQLESTAAIREWAASAPFDGQSAPSESYADLRAMCMKVIAETAVVCEQRDALVAENSALIAGNSALVAENSALVVAENSARIAENTAVKVENLKLKIQKALHEKSAPDTERTKEGEESSLDREPAQDPAQDFDPTLRHAGIRHTDGPCIDTACANAIDNGE